ncbi:MAG TPA: MmgE/PrpD family protein [Polyangiales bacterium]|nr:MmgE/PrpD family protein [Polyangiales bacterium]
MTRRLARHLAGVRYADLPDGAVRAAKRSLLDAIGVSLGASGLEPACAAFAELAAEQTGPCTILGFAQRSSPTMAAFANGALAHALDFEDAYDGAPAHPNAAPVPVALALAERDPGITGQELICALASGCDLVCRLALALEQNPDVYGFYPPPILAAFGAAATAAKLLRLDEDRIVAALALTLLQTTFSSQWKRDPHSTVRAVRDAFPAKAGLTAALLAARDVTGFEAAIEGEHGLYGLYARGAYDPAILLDGLGERFAGERVSFKPWPSCRGTHAFIEAALQLRERSGSIVRERSGSIDRTDKIEARGAPLNRMLMEPDAQKRMPSTAIDAKFSLPFCLGLALTRGAVTLDDFAPEQLANPDTLAIAARVSYSELPGAGMREATQGELTLWLRDGTRLDQRVERPLGHPDNPLDDAALIAKFIDCAGRARVPLAQERARRAAEVLFGIEREASAQTALQGLFD